MKTVKTAWVFERLVEVGVDGHSIVWLVSIDWICDSVNYSQRIQFEPTISASSAQRTCIFYVADFGTPLLLYLSFTTLLGWEVRVPRTINL